MTDNIPVSLNVHIDPLSHGQSAGSSILGDVAFALGATEPALRLLLSILAGYPLALLHRYSLYGKSPILQHILFILSGLSVGYFNYGWEVVHSMASVVVVYAVLLTIGGTVLSVAIVFIFSMSYLLTGYYLTGTETYDIKWSMAQCVLTLRLIGLAFDVYDGTKSADSLSDDQKKTALAKVPTFFEVAGHTFFPSSFLVGPQFPMRRYQDFVAGVLRDQDNETLPSCLLTGFMRGGLGFIYLGIFQVGISYCPDSYLLTPEFNMLPFVKRCLVLGFWAKITLYKYIACWLISEGVCICSGLTYNGKTMEGQSRWDGCANVKLRVYEGATKFGHFIASFNTNTNHWVAQYIYKRLKFMGNRYISQAAALVFLAVWHGLHSGYYMCFLMEFLVMKLEKDLEPLLERNGTVIELLKHPLVATVVWMALKLYTFVFMGWCLAPFALLSFSRWWQVYRSVYFIGFIVFLLWPLYYPIVKKLLTPKSLQKAKEN
ncbi:lysophospholipid acyltransferase 5 [Bacillus rossius redtenbacheri]|uniref:lysophospholipid acyltransferase 5 n=1 Tax=Bacillus rossius redtenbacheri TaxID=93214 RepID=UPI002FDD8BA5